MGFRKATEKGNRFRSDVAGGGSGGRVDVLRVSEAPSRRIAAGGIHRVAWRAADDESQKPWRERLVAEHLSVTPVLGRNYFPSVYFLEPGGVVFESATDPRFPY